MLTDGRKGSFRLRQHLPDVALYLTWRLSWFAVFNLETVLQQIRHLTWRQLHEGSVGIPVVCSTSLAVSKVTAASNPPNNLRDYFSKFSAAISRFSTVSPG